jgi:hypothetical protein
MRMRRPVMGRVVVLRRLVLLRVLAELVRSEVGAGLWLVMLILTGRV